MCKNEIVSHTLNDPFDLLRIIREITDTFRSHSVWWRGHRKSEWQLQPFVYRENRTSKYERNIGNHFLLKSPGLLSNPPDSDIDWLFLMQHSGLPTRLLDWTESPLIAMFFAVSKDTLDPATLWALDAAKMNEVVWGTDSLWTPTDPFVSLMAAAAFDVIADKDAVKIKDKVIPLVLCKVNSFNWDKAFLAWFWLYSW